MSALSLALEVNIYTYIHMLDSMSVTNSLGFPPFKGSSMQLNSYDLYSCVELNTFGGWVHHGIVPVNGNFFVGCRLKSHNQIFFNLKDLLIII